MPAPPRMMLCAAVLALLAGEARGLKEHLAVEGDGRRLITLDTFGFDPGGHIGLKMTEFTVRLASACSRLREGRARGGRARPDRRVLRR